jgi:hypothetical protein
VCGNPQYLGSSNSIFQREVYVGIDSAGNAIAAWRDLATSNILASYFNGSVWSIPTTVSANPGNFDLSFAMAPNGRAILIWQ